MNELATKRRKVLVIEDNELNKEILKSLLEDEYDVLTAENGEVGFKILSENYHDISLIFLDVYMPVCDGFTFLKMVRKDGLLNTIPVIVTTGSDNPEDETKCLDLGASDFVTKPYNPKAVKGRARSIIRLKESVATLNAVEYDELTGCYTMAAFCHHVEKKLNKEQNGKFDIFASDIIDFKIVNSVYGEKMGDYILTLLVNTYHKKWPESIITRHGDQIYVLYPAKHRMSLKNIQKMIEEICVEIQLKNLVIKCGVYKDVDVSIPVTSICDRVMLAVDAIKGNSSINYVYYDDELGNKSIRNQKLKANFEKALKREEFKIWFQPKVDTNTETIVGAEALVRWITSEGELINPGEFIPLFEKDGLIHELDEYVFTKVCEYQRARLDAGLTVFPISVNLSRNTAYHETTINDFLAIIEANKVPMELVPIELTESAAEEGSMIRAFAEDIIKAGFHLHMDDFGSGYSSLSNLGEIPFAELKIDKSLIDLVGTERGDVILKHIIEISQEMGMKVVAEGVEDKRQAEFLKDSGCEIIQGFYYYPPKAKHDFDNLVDEKKTNND